MRLMVVIMLVSLWTNTTAMEIVPLTEEQLSHTTVRVAAVQQANGWIWQGDDDAPQAVVDKVIAYIERAAADHCDMVVFPELLLGKFKVPNPSTERISAAAKQHGLYVLAGCFEITDDDGAFGNSTLIFDRNGTIIGRYFKTHPALGEPPFLWPPKEDDPEWTMTAGTEFPVFDLDFGRIGIMTCYDGHFPEPARIMSLKGAEMIIWPNARGGSVEDYIVRTEMARNYVHMVCTNKAIGAGTMIAEWPNTIRAITEEPGEAYLVQELNMTNLRLARKNAREFYQRHAVKYAEIAADYPVWEYYKHLDTTVHEPKHIELNPVIVNSPKLPEEGMREGQDLSPLTMLMKAAWMEGWVELRFPEVIMSPMGFHFIDHYLSTALQLNPLDPWPQWQYNERTMAWRYECTTKEGLYFAGEARPYRDTVYLTLNVTNKTGEMLDFVEMNPCFKFIQSPAFGKQWQLDTLMADFGGKMQSLAESTPTPKEKGRDPWVVMRMESKKEEWEGPSDSPTWWLLDQCADSNIMMAQSQDGKYLIGYSWGCEPRALMSNTGNPCLHTGPGPETWLDDGESYTRRGAIIFSNNDPEAMKERFLKMHQTWNRWPKRPVEETE